MESQAITTTEFNNNLGLTLLQLPKNLKHQLTYLGTINLAYTKAKQNKILKILPNLIKNFNQNSLKLENYLGRKKMQTLSKVINTFTFDIFIFIL